MALYAPPASANFLMAHLEEKFIYLLTDAETFLYLRLINHIFMLWIKSVEGLIKFLNELNTIISSIKFWFKYSIHLIEFLETDSDNHLQTTLYREPIDHQIYWNSNLAHPS